MKMWLLAISFAVTLGTMDGAPAQVYPSRPITMVVPFPPGGPLDTVARIMAEAMRVSLGQPIIIENVAGAAGSLGGGRVARAAATATPQRRLCGTHVINGAPTPSIRSVEGFRARLADRQYSWLIVANKAMPANDLKDLIAWLKANPDKRRRDHGAGSPHHVAAYSSRMKPVHAFSSCPIVAPLRQCRHWWPVRSK